MDRLLVSSIILTFFTATHAAQLADSEVLSLSSGTKNSAKLVDNVASHSEVESNLFPPAASAMKPIQRELYKTVDIAPQQALEGETTETPSASQPAANTTTSKPRNGTQTPEDNVNRPKKIENQATSAQSDEDEEAGTGIKLQVAINGLEDTEQLKNAKAFLDVYAESGKAVKNPSYINFLVKEGAAQIQQSLQPFGYYKAKVDVDNQQTADSWTVTYRVERGAPVILKRVDVSVEGEGKTQKEYQELVDKYPLQSGDVLVQEKYKNFKSDVVAFATMYGYFDADFTRKKIAIHEDYQGADITLKYDTKHRYHFGKTTIKQDFLDADVFERFLTFKEGDVYAAKEIADTQRDLYNSNYVKMIDVSAEPVKATQSVPVDFVIHPKANKKHTFAIGYGTDTGPRGKYTFDWRWVNRRGHQFKADLFVTPKKQETGVEYRIPAQKPATDYYKIFAYGKRDNSGDIDLRLWNVGGAYHDKVGNWEREFGLKWQQEDFTLGNDHGDLRLLTPFASLIYRKVDDPMNISRGVWLKGTLTGAHTSVLSDVSFLQAIGEAKASRKFAEKHKIKLAGAVGRTWVDNFHHLPASYRFFTGGDRTIRGYSYDKIGDRDSTGANIGGDRMYYLSTEYEYFFTDSMAAAVFVDAGDAYSADKGKIKVGAGSGFHYYSPIGPIRLDVAHGFDDDLGDKYRLHLNIGSEF